MAEKDAAIELEEDDAITVDVTDMPDLAEAEEKEKKPEKAPPLVQAQPPRKTSAPAAADVALNEPIRNAEAARAAAEKVAENERRQREAAEREAARRADELKAVREEAQGHELTIITNGIESAKSRQANATAEWERAMEAGEYNKAAKAQQEMAQASAEMVQLADAKARVESAPKRATTEGAVTTSGFEGWVSNFTPKSAAWLRQHPEFAPPEFGGDHEKNATMVAAHWKAQAKRIAPESQEYFDLIEQEFGLRAPAVSTAGGPVSAAATVTEAGSGDAPAPRARKAAPVAAPVSRDAPAVAGARLTRSVVLSGEQREAAKMSFPHLSEKEALALYARNLLQLESEGKIGRTTH